jgi:hypothetical protein
METDFFASMLVPPFHPSADWSEALAENLLHPHYPISMWEAIGRRLRRNYLWIYLVIGIAGLAKIWLTPTQAMTWEQFVRNARLGAISGEFILLVGLIFALILLGVSISTVGLHQSAGEVLPRYGLGPDWLFSNRKDKTSVRAWFRPSRHRQQLLTLIITDRVEAVSQRILKELNRGVTSLAGTGMYTGQSRSVLMVALTVTEIPQLKALVATEDPNAFVVVSPAQEIFGRGFMPLSENE